ncbi:MAG: S41 family peptidase [Clostridiaceae bacterium]|nr:S41 family peptidase [Clostridiaceae bacterium]
MSKKKWIIPGIAILLVTNIVSAYIGSTKLLSLPNGRIVTRQEVVQFQKIFQIKDQLHKYYALGDVKDDVLADGAVKGMTASLQDPYTVFMNKKDNDSFNTMMQGVYSGVGIVVEAKEDNIVVVSTFDESPAKKGGVLPNDLIVKVDGKDVSGKNLDAAITMIKGKDGTKVTLSFYREGKGLFDVELIRQKITTPNIKVEILNNNIGYIQMAMFDAHTGKEFSNKLAELKSKGIKGLVLDLRQNGGGYLDQCVEVTSNFVKKDDTIVYTIDKNDKKQIEKSIGGIGYGMKLVVLVDGSTASASEVFSGAIRDYKAGTIVGTKTFGKGIVQTTIPDRIDGSALKVTISKYFSPLGININKLGITPDIIIEDPDAIKYKGDINKDHQLQKAVEIMKDKIK